jgi:hypothetical protein
VNLPGRDRRRRREARTRAVAEAAGPGGRPEERFAAVYAALLGQAAGVPAVPDPLDAELAVSPLAGGPGPLSPDDVGLRDGLVPYLAGRADPVALALLRAASALSGPGLWGRARWAADTLAAAGVAEPSWSGLLGAVRPGTCWVYGDVFGDQESLVCTFTYGRATGGDAPQRSHGLVVLVDHNLGGIVKDVFCAPRAERTVEAIRLAHAEDGPMSVLEEVPPEQARVRLERAMDATESAWEPPVGDNARRLWALTRARVACLPVGAAPPFPQTVGERERTALVAEFLDSPQARTLTDRAVAAECARLVVDYGCDYDTGRPLRVSPAKTELLMLYWLPRQRTLTPRQLTAMPAVMEAWVRWAGSRQGLSGTPLREVVAAAEECAERFPATYGGDGPADG